MFFFFLNDNEPLLSQVYSGEDNAEVEAAVNAEKQDKKTQRYGNVTNELALTLTSTEENASGIRTDENTINYIDFDENKLIQHTMEENQVDDVNTDENNLDAGIYEIEIFDVPSAENMKIESITDAAETDEHRMDYNTDDVEMLDTVKELTADETKADEYMMEYNTAEVGLSDTINEEDVTGRIAFDEMEIKTEGIEISDAIVSMTTKVSTSQLTFNVNVNVNKASSIPGYAKPKYEVFVYETHSFQISR